MANSEQVNGVKPYQVRAKSSAEGEKDLLSPTAPRMPHERDESHDQRSGVRDDIKQAYDDVMSGQMDTDQRTQRGVEFTVDNNEEAKENAPIVPPNDSAVKNPLDKAK